MPLPDDATQAHLIRSLVPSPCGRFLAAGFAYRERAVVFDTATGAGRTLVTSRDEPCRPSFSPDGSCLFLAHSRSGCRAWTLSPNGWEADATTWPTSAWVTHSPDGDRVYFAAADGVLEFDAVSRAQRRLLPDADGPRTTFVCCTPDDRLVVVGEARLPEMRAYVRRLGPTPATLAVADHSPLDSPALTPCGTYLAGVTRGELVFYRTTDLALAARIDVGVSILAARAAFAPEGYMCAAAVAIGVVVMVPWRALL